MGRTSPRPVAPNFKKRVPTTRIVEVHAGNGQVEGNLLVGLERQVRQVERFAVDLVAVLFQPVQPLRLHGDALVAQESLVPLEGLPPCRMFLGVSGHLQGDGVQRQGLFGVEQDQDEVRHTFESVESCRASHRGEPTAAAIT